MPTLIDRHTLYAPFCIVLVVFLGAGHFGCGGEPSQRELQNARAFESLLTAVSLQHEKEVERDTRLIEDRHAAGELSSERYRELAEIIARARAKDWAGAQKLAYEFRKPFGDGGAYFK